jgi:curli biogenesis system outer membrane secretion channel CsgG
VGDAPDYALNSLQGDLSMRLKAVADHFKDQGRDGAAWYWYDKLKTVDPDYPGAFFLIQEVEDRITQRVQKSIAVFDFNSPSNMADAGIIVANNLITFLFNSASGDIKILERENLKSILEEMQLGQIGVVSAQTAQEMGRVYGIDVAIMGSVLLYQVDSSVSRGTKTVRYQVGTRIEDNIEYLNWKARHPKPTEKQLAEAPPAKVVKPQHAEKDYEVAEHKKVGFVQLSFRIVDIATGENIQVRTIERKDVVEDESSAGLEEADIEYDPLEIPTDTELLQQLTQSVVTELGREALRPLRNLEQAYYKEGEKLLRRRQNLDAAEKFVDAVFDERLKRIQGSPVTRNSMDKVEDIFHEYKIDLGG